MPLVFRRLKAPCSISVCMLFLLELGIALTLLFAFVTALFFIIVLNVFVPLSIFDEPNDGDRWIAWVACIDEVWEDFHLAVVLLKGHSCNFIVAGCRCTCEFPPAIVNFALKASRKDWFCKTTSGVEKLPVSLSRFEVLSFWFDEVALNVEVWNGRRDGELLLLKLVKMIQN